MIREGKIIGQSLGPVEPPEDLDDEQVEGRREQAPLLLGPYARARLPGRDPLHPDRERGAAARRALGRPERCALARALRWGYSRKGGSWPNFWADAASFSLADMRQIERVYL